MSNAVLFLRAQTSLHPGAGTSIGVIDLPVQRERHTDWPTVQGSSIKGVLRDAYRQYLIKQNAQLKRKDADNHLDLKAIFGPPAGVNLDHAGSLAVTDARILAFPVRSAKGVFALATCPAVIARLKEDLRMLGQANALVTPSVLTNNALLAPEAHSSLVVDFGNQRKLLLEDLLFNVGSVPNLNNLTDDELKAKNVADWMDGSCGSAAKKRLVILPDDAFGHLVKHSTELVTRVSLDYETKTASGKMLFTQELLPAETIFYSLLLADRPRDQKQSQKSSLHDANDVANALKTAINDCKLLQIGGEETTGKGWCWANVH
jgi:CRISPR-associated protein Cmr4